jgi:micrococcal nuclease
VNRNASFVSREAYLVDDEPRMIFLARYEQRFTNDDVLGYNSTRIFVLSTTPRWHGVCVPASIMAQSRTTFGALIAVGCILAFPYQVPAQQSTAPPSSLSTTPLAPGATESELRPSCDLCRKPEPRAGSTLNPHRLHREKGLRPHKKPKGMRRPSRRSVRALLRRQAFAPLGGIERTVDSGHVQVVDGDTFRDGTERVRLRGIDTPELNEPSGQAARLRLEELLHSGQVRIVPHGRDVYDRLVADVFVDGRNVAEMLAQEGYAKPRS